MLDKQITEAFNKIPGLGDIPILGKLFQSKTITKNNSELMIIITSTFAQAIAGSGPAVDIVAVLTLLRFIMGIGIGGDYPLSAVITSEFAATRSRGRLMTAVFALFASITLRLTGSLWLAVGAHAGWDWAQSYFYGVPDSGVLTSGHLLNSSYHGPEWLSGGSTGPEGSVLVLVLLIAMSVLFAALYRKKSEKIG